MENKKEVINRIWFLAIIAVAVALFADVVAYNIDINETYDMIFTGLLDAAYADLITPIEPVGNIRDTDGLLLFLTVGIDTFTLGDYTYAAVTSRIDHGVQILDITDPYNPVAAGNTRNIYNLLLTSAVGIDIFTLGDHTYAAVTSVIGVQILDITDPYNLVAAGNIGDTDDLLLNSAREIDTFTLGDHTYAAVTSRLDHGVQILDITDPYNPVAAGNIGDTDDLLLNSAREIDIFTLGDYTYAAVTSYVGNGVQILDITDPYNPVAAGNIGDTDDLLLNGANGIDTFTLGDYAYAAVTSYDGNGVQILDITDPYNPVATGNIKDTYDLLFYSPRGIDVFTLGDYTYAAVILGFEKGVQILDITDPYNPVAAGNIKDTDDLLLYNARGIDVFTLGDYAYAAVTANLENGVQILKIGIISDDIEQEESEPVPTSERSDAEKLLIIRAWVGFEQETVTDYELLQAFNLEHYGTIHIPNWVMIQLGKLTSNNNITISEFETALEYVLDNY